jgi:hypothetical protein
MSPIWFGWRWDVSARRYRARVDVELILDAAAAEAPGLRDRARRFLEAEAARLGVSLDLVGVLARRAEGVPEVHITAAADELLGHLVAAGPDPLGEDSSLTALALGRCPGATDQGGAGWAPPEFRGHRDLKCRAWHERIAFCALRYSLLLLLDLPGGNGEGADNVRLSRI